jgi:hypothetical protein
VLSINKVSDTFFEKAANGFMSSSYIFLYFASTSEEPLSRSSAYYNNTTKVKCNKMQRRQIYIKKICDKPFLVPWKQSCHGYSPGHIESFHTVAHYQL